MSDRQKYLAQVGVHNLRDCAHQLLPEIHEGRVQVNRLRPREGSRERGWGAYLDTDNPTLVTFDALDQRPGRRGFGSSGAMTSITAMPSRPGRRSRASLPSPRPTWRRRAGSYR